MQGGENLAAVYGRRSNEPFRLAGWRQRALLVHLSGLELRQLSTRLLDLRDLISEITDVRACLPT